MSSRRRRITLLVIATVLLLLIGGRVAAEFVVELLWYQALGHDSVFWTLWGTGMAARAALALPIGLVVFGNLWVVTRSLGTLRVRRRYANIEIAEQIPQSYIVGSLLLISFLSAWWLSSGASEPLGALAYLRHDAWGVTDPLFERDLSFYVFELPLLERLQTTAGLLVFWSALLVGAAYVATGAIRAAPGELTSSVLARRHLGLLLAAFLLVFAWDVWLDRYGLLLEGNGVGGSLGYTDVQARLPGKLLLVLLGVLAAAGVAYGAWRGSRREPLAAGALLLLGLIGANLVYPAAVQKLAVEPNEFPRERPYIEPHLAFTRLGYGLADLSRVTFAYRRPEGIPEERLLNVLAGVPLWDGRPLLEAFGQEQALFRYYDFVSIHSDRYGPPGREEQVALAVRELDPSQLPETAQTWQNLHLTYVSGEGVVAAPVSRMTADGSPMYYVYDLDPPKLAPDAPPSMALKQSQVYFGERTRGYVVLRPEQGQTGVQLDATWKKLVFAWAFQSKNLFLSGDVTPGSQVIYRRAVQDRARAVAPFLHFSPTAGGLPVVHQGRVVWILDGYTGSAWFPLSRDTIFEGAPVRYLRNSAKVTVDGVTGQVRVFAVDSGDPILRTFARVFPDLVRPVAEMDPELRRHLRVPPQLVTLQGQILGEYHMEDPQAFYRKQDAWDRAIEQFRGETVPTEPIFSMLPLPGEPRREFLLSMPFVARGRQNMTALLVTRNDPPHYGEQLLLQMPRDELVPGPQQIEAMIDQDPEISQQLSLWRQGGSDVVRGHMIVVPLDSTLVYVEPVYLVADNSAIPQLARVVLATGGEVVMRPTLSGAVAALLGTAADTAQAVPAAAGPRDAEGPDTTEILGRARRLLEQAEARLRAGDWVGFGRSWSALQELLGGTAAAEGAPR